MTKHLMLSNKQSQSVFRKKDQTPRLSILKLTCQDFSAYTVKTKRSQRKQARWYVKRHIFHLLLQGVIICQEKHTWKRFMFSQISREDAFLLQLIYFSISFSLTKVVPEPLPTLLPLLLKLSASYRYCQHGVRFIIFFFIADFYIFGQYFPLQNYFLYTRKLFFFF